MNAKEFRQIAKTMREFGLSRVKWEGVELELYPTNYAITSGGYIGNGRDDPSKPSIDLNAPAPESNPIEHKVEQLTSLMKLSDVQLVDQLFPEPVEPTDDEDVA